MRKATWLIAAMALMVGCSKSSDTDAGAGSTGQTGCTPQAGTVLTTDQPALEFGLQFGNATALGTQPLATLQLLNQGTADVVVTKIEIVAPVKADGTPAEASEVAQDGGTIFVPLVQPDGTNITDTSAFTLTAPTLPDTIASCQNDFVQVVFAPTTPGLYGAILRITSNAPNSPLDVVLAGLVQTPLVTVESYTQADGTVVQGSPPGMAITATPIVLNDGGSNFTVGYGTARLTFANTGTDQLAFQNATVASDAGNAFYICTGSIQLNAQLACPQPGPLPSTLDPVFPDGGLAGFATDAGFQPNLSTLQIVFSTATPGTYTQHVIVDSNATNTPELVFTVTGTATAP